MPGALARLGVRRPGGAFDLHQGTFDLDEDALDVGVRYTVALAREALDARAADRRQSPSERQGRARSSATYSSGAPAASAASAIKPR